MDFNATFIFGLITSITAICSLQLKDMRLILVFQILCNLSGGISYILSGGLSGCGIYIIAVFQSIIYFIFRSKNINAPKYLAYIFAGCYLICSALTYKGIIDVLPALAALTCAFALAQQRPFVYRLLLLLNGIIWLSYDVFLPATITMWASHAIVIVFSVIGIIRLDIKKRAR